jgi:hypothetical protein
MTDSCSFQQLPARLAGQRRLRVVKISAWLIRIGREYGAMYAGMVPAHPPAPYCLTLSLIPS